ncbi:Dps family protein [Lentiprolixibacter aurantiacus]|uniref:DNA starvation/stationary phase protection protein n=1 Tax=Lentiprolixibacter aurantiacus TaxID=2993939 RepID=A0AAE3MM52_9FLAO|nr:DNA starvation/stationary phase protection protein [Lentiprolixibacter aurantiacus]MCX2720385.1 DNA starvation/stationary phase protection protein [Lentiprolixibacter aurantiacus]
MENTKTLNKTIDKKTIKDKTYKKLGFTYLDTADIVVRLKKVLANYQVHYHKLRKYHWNVEGPDFFELHEEFEKDYKDVMQKTDEIAERIRVFGLKPMMNMKDSIELSNIKETKKELSGIAMVREILSDYEIIHDDLLAALKVSLDTGDSATELMLNRFIADLEKRNWMYTSWCK